MPRFQRGELIELDGLLGAVIGIEGDKDVPEEHVMIWFGEPRTKRVSQGGQPKTRPVVWTVLEEYCELAVAAEIKH